MNLGQRITDRRRKLQITQQDLAQALNLTPQHISAIEKGKKIPSLDLTTKIAEQLGVSIDYLVSGKEGTVKDTISAIRADDRINPKIKKSLISLVEELRTINSGDNT